MRAGDVFFGDGTHVAGRVIQYWDRTRYNHCGIVLDEAGNIAESVGGGFLFTGKVRPGSVVASPKDMTDAQRLLVPGIATGLMGTPYGYADVITLGLAKVGLARGWVARHIENPTHLFCSQATDFVWNLAGFHAFTDGRLPHNVTPGDIFDLAARNNWEFEVV